MCFACAFYIALSRISDYRHHPEDVVVGIVVGLFFAAIILMFLADIFNRPRSFQVKYSQIVDDDMDLKQVVTPRSAARSGGGAGSDAVDK